MAFNLETQSVGLYTLIQKITVRRRIIIQDYNKGLFMNLY